MATVIQILLLCVVPVYHMPLFSNFIKKATSIQVFFCELCKIFKNTFFTKHLQETTSEWVVITAITKGSLFPAITYIWRNNLLIKRK